MILAFGLFVFIIGIYYNSVKKGDVGASYYMLLGYICFFVVCIMSCIICAIQRCNDEETVYRLRLKGSQFNNYFNTMNLNVFNSRMIRWISQYYAEEIIVQYYGNVVHTNQN